MKRAGAVIVTFALVLLSGCGIEGKWRFQEVMPTDARGQFQFGEVTFRPDGAFDAIADFGDGAKPSSGAYTFSNGELALTNANGDKIVYDAAIESMGSILRVKKMMHGKEVMATFKRQ